jgi:hypothetical protein
MDEPAIRGGTFLLAAEDLIAAIERGAVAREAVEAELRREDIELLYSKPAAASWVPIASYARIVDVLVRVEAGGDGVAYLRRRGARAAERGFDSGVFAQLRHGAVIGELTETGGKHIFKELDGRLMTSISAAIFNFGSWSFRDTGEGYEVEARDVGPMPEGTRHAIAGFLEVMAVRTSLQDLTVTSRRDSRDRIVFEIPYPR